MSDPRVLLEKDPQTHVARLTLNQPEKKNCYDPPMRRAMAAAMNDVAEDDDMKVLLLRGAEGIFCTGADMRNAYSWYETKGDDRRPSQRRKIAVDRESFSFYHDARKWTERSREKVDRQNVTDFIRDRNRRETALFPPML